MAELPLTLERIDYVLTAAGGVVLLANALAWWRRGRRDQLRGAPLRPNHLSPLLIWLCFLVHFLGWAIGAQLAVFATPAGLELDAEALGSWQGLFAANLTQVFVAVTCLAVARLAFRTGWRGFGIGRQPIGSELAATLAGLLAAFCVCNLLALATTELIELLVPRFRYPAHSVFKALEHPAVTPAMRMLAIGGALILAPVGEELFFRGILQTGIKKLVPRRWGSMRHRWIAIGATAMLFAIMHTATPHHVAALAALGVILGYLYERRGSLVVPILIHMLFNGKSLLWHQLNEWCV